MHALSPCKGPVESFFNFIQIPLSMLWGVSKIFLTESIYYHEGEGHFHVSPCNKTRTTFL